MNVFKKYRMRMLLAFLAAALFTSEKNTLAAAANSVPVWIGLYNTNGYDFAYQTLKLPFLEIDLANEWTNQITTHQRGRTTFTDTSAIKSFAFQIVDATNLPAAQNTFNAVWHPWALSNNLVQWGATIQILAGLFYGHNVQAGDLYVGQFGTIAVNPHDNHYSPNNAHFSISPNTTVSFFIAVATYQAPGGQRYLNYNPTLLIKNPQLKNLISGPLATAIFPITGTFQNDMKLNDLIKILEIVGGTENLAPASNNTTKVTIIKELFRTAFTTRFDRIITRDGENGLINFYDALFHAAEHATTTLTMADRVAINQTAHFLKNGLLPLHTELTITPLKHDPSGDTLLARQGGALVPAGTTDDADLAAALRNSRTDTSPRENLINQLVTAVQRAEERDVDTIQVIAETLRDRFPGIDAEEIVSEALLRITDPTSTPIQPAPIQPAPAPTVSSNPQVTTSAHAGLAPNILAELNAAIAADTAANQNQTRPPLATGECIICADNTRVIAFTEGALCADCLSGLQIQGRQGDMGVHHPTGRFLIPTALFASYNIEPNASGSIADQPIYNVDQLSTPMQTLIEIMQIAPVTAAEIMQATAGAQLTSEEEAAIASANAIREYNQAAQAFHDYMQAKVRELVEPRFDGTGPTPEWMANTRQAPQNTGTQPGVAPSTADTLVGFFNNLIARTPENPNPAVDNPAITVSGTQIPTPQPTAVVVPLIQPVTTSVGAEPAPTQTNYSGPQPTDPAQLNVFNQLLTTLETDPQIELRNVLVWNSLEAPFQQELINFQQTLICQICDHPYDNDEHRRIVLHPGSGHEACATCLPSLVPVRQNWWDPIPSCPICRENLPTDLLETNHVTRPTTTTPTVYRPEPTPQATAEEAAREETARQLVAVNLLKTALRSDRNFSLPPVGYTVPINTDAFRQSTLGQANWRTYEIYRGVLNYQRIINERYYFTTDIVNDLTNRLMEQNIPNLSRQQAQSFAEQYSLSVSRSSLSWRQASFLTRAQQTEYQNWNNHIDTAWLRTHPEMQYTGLIRRFLNLDSTTQNELRAFQATLPARTANIYDPSGSTPDSSSVSPTVPSPSSPTTPGSVSPTHNGAQPFTAEELADLTALREELNNTYISLESFRQHIIDGQNDSDPAFTALTENNMPLYYEDWLLTTNQQNRVDSQPANIQITPQINSSVVPQATVRPAIQNIQSAEASQLTALIAEIQGGSPTQLMSEESFRDYLTGALADYPALILGNTSNYYQALCAAYAP